MYRLFEVHSIPKAVKGGIGRGRGTHDTCNTPDSCLLQVKHHAGGPGDGLGVGHHHHHHHTRDNQDVPGLPWIAGIKVEIQGGCGGGSKR